MQSACLAVDEEENEKAKESQNKDATKARSTYLSDDDIKYPVCCNDDTNELVLFRVHRILN